MENYAALEKSLASLNDASFEWQKRVYKVRGTKRLFERWVIFTDLRTFTWDSLQFADWLEEIVITDKPPTPRLSIAVPDKRKPVFERPEAVLAECDKRRELPSLPVEMPTVSSKRRTVKNVKNLTLKNKLMSLESKIDKVGESSVATAVNANAATMADSLMKEFAVLDNAPTEVDINRIMAKCKLTDTVVGIATLQVKVEQLKRG